jgi:hypothetical protein
MQLGLIGLLCSFCAPVALVLALLAKREMARQPGRYSNASHATIGIVTGGFISALFVASLVVAIAHGGSRQDTLPAARATKAMSAPGAAKAGAAPEMPNAPVAVVEPKRSRGHVERSEFGDPWPLTVEAGDLSCEPPGAVFFTVGGVRYSVNGLAKARRFNARDIEPIWARDEELIRTTKGTADFRKSIGPLIERGRELCR